MKYLLMSFLLALACLGLSNSAWAVLPREVTWPPRF